MKQVSKDEILNLAQAFQTNNETWHYHLLTPTCQFNSTDEFAIYMENVDTHDVFAHYTDTAEMQLSNTLSGMVHGKEVLKQSNAASDYAPSTEVRAILELIERLGTNRVKWHHHVFFPGCSFNSSGTKYELVVEDPELGSYLKSVTDDEPKEDLKQIEQKFYSQKAL